jgi:hypothetical protein
LRYSFLNLSINLTYLCSLFLIFIFRINEINLGIGDWGLGIGDWANPQSPIPNPLVYDGMYSRIKVNGQNKLKWGGQLAPTDLTQIAKENNCCGLKAFVTDCLFGRCAYCCKKDGEVADGLAFSPPNIAYQDYSGESRLKCCSGRVAKERVQLSTKKLYLDRDVCCTKDLTSKLEGKSITYKCM